MIQDFMTHETKTLDDGQLEITFDLTVDEQKPFLQKAADALSMAKPLAGFRPGKAPLDVAMKHFGPMRLLEHATEDMVKKTFAAYVVKEALATIGQPKIEVLQLAPENSFRFRATVSLLPTVTIGDLNKIRITRQKPEVSQAEVDEATDQLRNWRAQESEVQRPAAMGDRVYMSFNVFRDKVPIEGGSHNDYPVILGEGKLIPGLEEQVVGMSAGETKEFTLTFPEKYFQKMLAGKPAEFKLTVNKVIQRTLPTLDDAFASMVSNGQAPTLMELKTKLRANLEEDQKMKLEEKAEQEMLEAVVNHTTFGPIPQTLVDHELGKMMHELKHHIEEQGIEFSQYLLDIKKTEADLRQEMSKQATMRVQTALALRHIFLDQKLEVSEDEVTQRVEQTAAAYPNDQAVLDQVKSEQYRDHVHNLIANRKTIDYLKQQLITE